MMRLTSRRSQPPLALSVPLSRFTPRVGGGSAFFVRPLRTSQTMRSLLRYSVVLVAVYLVAWTVSYAVMIGFDFRYFFQYLRLAWTFSGGELHRRSPCFSVSSRSCRWRCWRFIF